MQRQLVDGIYWDVVRYIQRYDMTIYVKDSTTDKAVRELAKLRGLSLTETIREAVELALSTERKNRPLSELIKDLQDDIAAYPSTGLEADKAFYDELSGQ